jgi:hypothetical protein
VKHFACLHCRLSQPYRAFGRGVTYWLYFTYVRCALVAVGHYLCDESSLASRLQPARPRPWAYGSRQRVWRTVLGGRSDVNTPTSALSPSLWQLWQLTVWSWDGSRKTLMAGTVDKAKISRVADFLRRIDRGDDVRLLTLALWNWRQPGANCSMRGTHRP